MPMSRWALFAIAATLATPLAAQTTGQTTPTGPAAAPGETSDRTPGKQTPTPLEQIDKVPAGGSAASGTASGQTGAAAPNTPTGPASPPGATSDRTPKDRSGEGAGQTQQK